MSRAPQLVGGMGMSTAAACLLLSQYAPATARLFAQFRRLRGSLPPAEMRKLMALENANGQNANMTCVRAA